MHLHRYRILGLLAGCFALNLLAAVAHAQPGAEASKQEVVKLFDKWNEALQTGKPDEVVKLYAPDAVLLPTVSNKVRRNPAELKDYFEQFLQLKPRGKIDQQNIRIFGPVAINSGIYTFTLTKHGKPSQVQARYTFVYRRDGDRWLIVEHHSSAMPEPTK
jgi:uncharacterized protein (TIGR02246 family)